MEDNKGNVHKVEDNRFIMPSNSYAIVKATFKQVVIPDYTVTFDANGGSGTMADIVQEENSAYELPENQFTPPPGKVFKAWDYKGVEIEPRVEMVLREDVTIKAIWEDGNVADYAITYGPFVNGTVTGQARARANEVVNFTINPDTGYRIKTFKVTGDVFVPSAHNGSNGSFIMPASNVKVEATFISNDIVTLYFDSGDGSGGMDPVDIPKNTDYTLPVSTFTPPPGKVFKAWDTRDGELTPGQKIRFDGRYGEEFITALYKEIPTVEKVKITFNANGGTGTMSDIEINKNDAFTLPTSTFTPPPSKEFKAWDVDGVEKLAGENIIVSNDITVNAVWKDRAVEKVKITFDANGGTGTMSDIELNKNDAFTLPTSTFTPPPSKEFKAWNVDGLEKLAGESIIVANNTAVKAVWKDKVVTPPSSGGGGSLSPVRPDSTETDKTKDNTTSGDKKITVEIRFKIGSKIVNKVENGVPTTIVMDVVPYIINGRVMIPLRFIGEVLDYEAKWDPATRTAILTNKDTKIEVPINTNNIVVNGEAFVGDVKPILENGRTMLSIGNIIRALGESSGVDIKWEPSTQEVIVRR